MEKLQQRSDGYFETPSGLFAIAPRAVSGKRDGLSWFEYKAGHLSEVTRVEWPDTAPVIAIEQESAIVMIRNRYAYNITVEQMNDYNAAVDAYLAENGFDPANVPTPVPVAQTPEPVPAAVPEVPVPDAPAAAAPTPTEPPAVPAAPAVPEAPADAAVATPKKGK